MKHPVLVRVVDMKPNSEDAMKFAAAGNVATTMSQSAIRSAASHARLIDDEMINSLKLEGDTTFSDAVSSDSPQAKSFRQRLRAALDPTEVPRYFNESDGKLNDAGKEYARAMLMTKAFPVKAIESLGEERRGLKRTLEASIPQLLKAKRDFPQFDVSQAMTQAVEFIAKYPEARTSQDVDNIMSQQVSPALGGEKEQVADTLAKFLVEHGNNAKTFRAGIGRILSDLNDKGGMFGKEVPGQAQIAKEAAEAATAAPQEEKPIASPEQIQDIGKRVAGGESLSKIAAEHKLPLMQLTWELKKAGVKIPSPKMEKVPEQQQQAAPVPTPAPQQQQQQQAAGGSDVTKIPELFSDFGKSVSSSLYKQLYDSLSQGKDTMAGVKDPVLAKAKQAFDQGLVKSSDDLRKLVAAGYDTQKAGLGQQQPGAQPGAAPPQSAANRFRQQQLDQLNKDITEAEERTRLSDPNRPENKGLSARELMNRAAAGGAKRPLGDLQRERQELMAEMAKEKAPQPGAAPPAAPEIHPDEMKRQAESKLSAHLDQILADPAILQRAIEKGPDAVFADKTVKAMLRPFSGNVKAALERMVMNRVKYAKDTAAKQGGKPGAGGVAGAKSQPVQITVQTSAVPADLSLIPTILLSVGQWMLKGTSKASGVNVWRNTATKEVRYQNDMPGSHKAAAQAPAAAPRPAAAAPVADISERGGVSVEVEKIPEVVTKPAAEPAAELPIRQRLLDSVAKCFPTSMLKRDYEKAVGRVMDAIPQEAQKRIDAHVVKSFFGAHGEDIVEEIKSDNLKSGWPPLMSDQEKKLSRSRGVYNRNTKTVYIDGGANEKMIRQTAAHELTHAIDGPNADFSEAFLWRTAWVDEIFRTDNLSKYAKTHPIEGFAEFGRLLYGTDTPKEEIKKKFPQCYDFFENKGLI